MQLQLAEPRSEFAKAVISLAKQVAPQGQPKEQKKQQRKVLSLARS